MSHNHNLSINSVNSLIEPTTPPNLVQRHTRSTSVLSGSGGSGSSVVGASVATPFHHTKSGSLSGSNLLFAGPQSFGSSVNVNGNVANSSAGVSGANSSANSHGSANSRSVLWESSAKLNHNLNLPNFNIDQLSLHDSSNSSNYVQLESGSVFGKSDEPARASNRQNGQNGQIFAQHAQNVQNSVHNVSAATEASSVSSTDNSATSSVAATTTPPPSGGSAPSTAAPAVTSGAAKKIDKDYIASISKIPLVQLKQEILTLSKDQYGCRFLQKKIDENLIPNYQTRLSNFEVIFAQIHPYLYELIIDPFGNYLIQKLIVYCNETNLDLILQILQYNLFQISINQHGTRALQKIIDNLNNQSQLNLLIKGMKPYIIELIKDLNGNHVIQKILNKYPPSDCQFIYDSIIEGLYVVASHKHGCCVLQKCLNHVTMKQLQEFSACILDFTNFQLLINDQFGNYVLQYLISINSWEINYKIFQNFLQFGINNLCNLKFSSNVVEKFLKNCYNNEAYNGVTAVNFSNLKMELIYNILINDLNKLINDPYGNYVIQTLIDILINKQVPSEKIEKLSLLLPVQEPIDDSQLQVVIIKYWFSNCKIVSSFGKRIQSKINSIVSDRNHVHSVGTSSNNKPFQQNLSQNSYRRNLSISSDKSGSAMNGPVTTTRNMSLPLSLNEQVQKVQMIGNEYASKDYQYGFPHQQLPYNQQQNQQHSQVQQQNQLSQNMHPNLIQHPSQNHQQSSQYGHGHKMSFSQDSQLQHQQPLSHYTTAKPRQQQSQYTPPPMNYQYQPHANLTSLPQHQQHQQLQQYMLQQKQQQHPHHYSQQSLQNESLQNQQQYQLQQQQQFLPSLNSGTKNGWMKM